MASKGQYAEMIAILQELQTKLEPFVDPNSETSQVLNRYLKDLPKDDKNGQKIAEGLVYFRNVNNKIGNYIRILQRADKGGA